MSYDKENVESYLREKIAEMESAIKALNRIQNPNRQTKQTVYESIVRLDIYKELLQELKSE